MTDQYTETVAAHYAAYRPPLHQRILKRVLSGSSSLSVGLDVGCGTGRSSEALAGFCERVFAVDPSESMLDAATPHEAITYLKGSAENIPLSDRSIDIATFAGSLSYANLDATVEELTRVCRPDALIVPYDFSMLIDNVLRPFDVAMQAPDSTYDHRAGFSGISAFIEILAKQEIQLNIKTTDLAHILLADLARFDTFARRYKTTTPLMDLATELGSNTQGTMIEADIFYSLYQFSGDPKERSRQCQ
jgi:SAM-dependent methyltransferase